MTASSFIIQPPPFSADLIVGGVKNPAPDASPPRGAPSASELSTPNQHKMSADWFNWFNKLTAKFVRGDFTGTLIGNNVVSNVAMSYAASGDLVLLWSAAGGTGTSTAGQLFLGSIPLAISPLGNATASFPIWLAAGLTDNGITALRGIATWRTGAPTAFQLGLEKVAGANIQGQLANFTAGGVCGLSPGFSMVYSLR